MLKLHKDPLATIEYVKDDHGHYIPANTNIIEGTYCKIFNETKEGDLQYFDTSKSTTILCLSVVGICPEFVEIEQMT